MYAFNVICMQSFRCWTCCKSPVVLIGGSKEQVPHHHHHHPHHPHRHHHHHHHHQHHHHHVVAPPCFHQHHHHHVVASLVLPQKPTLLQPQYINDLNAWVFCTPARCCGPALFCLRSTTLLCCATKFKHPLPNDPRFVRGSHILRRYCNRYGPYRCLSCNITMIVLEMEHGLTRI